MAGVQLGGPTARAALGVAGIHSAAVALVLGIALGWSSSSVAAGPNSRSSRSRATTSRAAQHSATSSIPFEKLNADARAKVASVISKVSIFRRMPIRVIQCDPDLYLFLVRNPDVVVNIWEVLGISELKLVRTDADTYQLTDGAGTTGTIEFIYRSFDTHIAYVNGASESPLFGRPVQGRGVMILKTGYVREPDGKYYITTRLDTFMQLEPSGAEFLTKTFEPLVGRAADTNFLQTAGFVGSLSRTAEVNSRGVGRLATKLSRVQPEVRQQFAKLAQRVALKTSARTSRRPLGGPIVATRLSVGD